MEIQIQTILCPVDFSRPAEHALVYACAIARRHGASLELLHVLEPSAYSHDERSPALPPYEAVLQEKLRLMAETTGCPTTITLLEGIPYLAIVERASERHADLIVIGTHGRTGAKHLLIGSVAERVVRTAACPVLAVPHPATNPGM